MAAFMHRLAVNQVVDAATVERMTPDDLRSSAVEPAAPAYLSGVYRPFDFGTFEGVASVVAGASEPIAAMDLDPDDGACAIIDFGSVVFQSLHRRDPDEPTAFAAAWVQEGPGECDPPFGPDIVLPVLIPGSLVATALSSGLPHPLGRSSTLELADPTTVDLWVAYQA